MALPFYTVGHSNLDLAGFVALLGGPQVARVLDVRAFPRSRSNPQFNTDGLPRALAECGIGYEHLPALGGRRGRARDVPPDVNGLWRNESFHNYADYALSDPFRAGLAQLRAAGDREVCAIMCSEALWWRCHRRIIADYLLARQAAVLHIMPDGRVVSARLTPGAIVLGDGTIVYPAA